MLLRTTVDFKHWSLQLACVMMQQRQVGLSWESAGMFGQFFDTTEVDRLADWVVAEVKRALPPRQTPGASGKTNRADKLNQVLSSRVAEFSRNSSLNIYKKAHLAARVREAMTVHGYPEPFVKAFSIDLLAQLRAAKSRKQ